MNELFENLETSEERGDMGEMQEMYRQKYEQALDNGDAANAEFWKAKLDGLEGAPEAQETDGAEKLGYSSDYYEHQMAAAIENGNSIAYENAKKNYAKAKAREAAS